MSGDAKESGGLEDFRIAGPKKYVYEKGQFTFEILFRNDGNVHLLPYGVIEVRNVFGSVVAKLPIDPYFALPDATRFRSLSFDGGLLFGRYSAVVFLNRGYDDIVDERSLSVWVFPWKWILAVVAVFLALVALVCFLRGRFEIRRRI